MTTQALVKNDRMPSIFEDFFKPWNEWFDNSNFPGRSLSMPAVNITEEKNEFLVSLAAPGLKREDFKIDVAGNMITISSETEENKKEENKKFNRKEYSYSSFSRSFTLPDEVIKDKIAAKYKDGVLQISLPRKNENNTLTAKHIAVN